MFTKTDEKKREAIATMYGKVRGSFPGINELSAEEFSALRDDPDVVLVDVRTPEEQAVSMIPGAVTQEEFAARADEFKDRKVVAYCTIGGRSGQFTQQLAAQGWNVHNMKGAILAWTHCGGELECDGTATKRVHVHGRKFDLVADGYESVY